jgi:hypothetical protein
MKGIRKCPQKERGGKFHLFYQIFHLATLLVDGALPNLLL